MQTKDDLDIESFKKDSEPDILDVWEKDMQVPPRKTEKTAEKNLVDAIYS